MNPGGPGYFVTGGTVPTGSKSYVERQADRELIEALHAGEFCYILTARQMGKSSLMVRTAARLREQGVSVAVLDLTAIGQNVTPAQWYDGLAQRLGRQLRMEDEIDDYWLDNEKLGPCQRLFGAIRDVALPKQKSKLVIFVDEIDAIRSLPFKPDEFFAAIRELYNRRTEDPELTRVTFCLLGVATPSDLIQDARTTPFNIGRRIALSDFTPEEADPLAEGLTHGQDGHFDMTLEEARRVLERILYWTGGQPFLTQRFCRAIKERNDAEGDLKKKLRTRRDVDGLCQDLFLSHRSRESDDNLALVRNRLLNADVDRASLLDIYRRVHLGRHVEDDETSPAINRLRLAGIVRAEQGRLILRNRIYRDVFDIKWIQSNLPEPEKLRQRQAFRSGLRRGLVAGLVLVVGLVALAYFVRPELMEIGILRASNNIGSAYEKLQTYRDTSEIRVEMELQGASIFSGTTNKFWMEKPDRLRIELVQSLVSDEMHLVLVRNGTNLWVHSPDTETYMHRVVTNSLADTLKEFNKFSGARLDDTLYRFLVVQDFRKDPVTALKMESTSKIFVSQQKEGKRMMNIFNWERRTLTSSEKMTNAVVAGWVEPMTGLVRRLKTDYTGILTETMVPGRPGPVPIQRLVVEATHLEPEINSPQPFGPEIFQFTPPNGTKQVQEYMELRRFGGGRFRRPDRGGPGREGMTVRPIIPPRSPSVERHLVDVSSKYNAGLTDPWIDAERKLDLASFEPGTRRIDGIEFDVRGVIQLGGGNRPAQDGHYPRQVAGLPVKARCRHIHFLHGTAGAVTPGTHIGSYLVHYEDGQERLVPVVYGYDVRDWASKTPPEDLARGVRPAWTGTNNQGGPVELFHLSWWNPRVDVEVSSIDFISTQSVSAPFLLAITIEE